MKISSLALQFPKVSWLFSFLALGKDRNSKRQVSTKQTQDKIYLFVCFGGCLHNKRPHMGNKERTLRSWLKQLQSDKLQEKKNGKRFQRTRFKNPPSLGFLLAYTSQLRDVKQSRALWEPKNNHRGKIAVSFHLRSFYRCKELGTWIKITAIFCSSSCH